jgi:hypothetical protein
MSSGFQPVSVQTRKLMDHFYDLDDLLDFHLENSLDAQLPDFDLAGEKRLRVALKRELEKHSSPRGIEQERYVIIAVGEKPYLS